MWMQEIYATSKHIYWAVAVFMTFVIAIASDSVARDFILLGGIIVIVAVTEFRDYVAQYRSESSSIK